MPDKSWFYTCELCQRVFADKEHRKGEYTCQDCLTKRSQNAKSWEASSPTRDDTGTRDF